MEAVRTLGVRRPRQLRRDARRAIPALLVVVAGGLAVGIVVVLCVPPLLAAQLDVPWVTFPVQLLVIDVVGSLVAALGGWAFSGRDAGLSARLQLLAALALGAAAALALAHKAEWQTAASGRPGLALVPLALGGCAALAAGAAAVSTIRAVALVRARRCATVVGIASYLDQLDAHLRTTRRVRLRILAELEDHLACAVEARGLEAGIAALGSPAQVASAFERRAAFASVRAIAWVALAAVAAGVAALTFELAAYVDSALATDQVTPAVIWLGPVWNAIPEERTSSLLAFLPMNLRDGNALALAVYATVALAAGIAAVALARRTPRIALGLVVAALGAGGVAVWCATRLQRWWSLPFARHEVHWLLAAAGIVLAVVGVLALERSLAPLRLATLAVAAIALVAPLPLIAAWKTPTAPNGAFWGPPDSLFSGGITHAGPRGTPVALAQGDRIAYAWVGWDTPTQAPRRLALRVATPNASATGPVAVVPVRDPGAIRSLALLELAGTPVLAWATADRLVVRSGGATRIVGSGRFSGVRLLQVGRAALLVAQQGGRVVFAAGPSWRIVGGPTGRLLAAAATPELIGIATQRRGSVRFEVLSRRLVPLRHTDLVSKGMRVALGTAHGRLALAYSALDRSGRALWLAIDRGGRWERLVVSRALPCSAPRAVGMLTGRRAAVVVGSACGPAVEGHLLVQSAPAWRDYVLNDAGANAGAAFVRGRPARLATSFDRVPGLSIVLSS